MTASAKPVLVWFRKDLRLDDNLALTAAAQSGGPVIPVYIREPEEAGTGPLGAAQAWWLHHSLATLQKSFEKLGSRLILASGSAEDLLPRLIKATGAGAVYWNRRYDPPGIAIDTPLKKSLAETGIEVKSFAGQLLHEPTHLLTGQGTPYKVYTPFWKAFNSEDGPRDPVDPPKSLKSPEKWPKSEDVTDWGYLPTKPNWAEHFPEMWEPGEAAAHKRLKLFLDSHVKDYDSLRDFPGVDATSRLSPYLALGEISPARIWHSTNGLMDRYGTDGVLRFRKEIIWREFSYHLLFHFPELAEKNWNSKFDNFPWEFNEKLFEAWKKGETGYPIVDAGMRQLWKHGWMHNRVRMVVASFLIKHCLIDWRHGEKWFRDTLVDADPASNAASWQWVAGSGADAAPFFRVFNPITQGEKFDPDGDYISRYVPILAKLPSKYKNVPDKSPPAFLEKAGVRIGETYPEPIVDHMKAREKALSTHSALSDD
ncbi:cryptochrome/photolyase family protein [Rhizobium sp. NRK18]|uniref:cryptochrome/photolyase family protein n=1 Tax=Rhizobium sp. NRK18 TaxID=2964667 RepID=UPI0021C2F650|nr:deoxyribodipyrimidine photo-lyase [Rhizobium sp. NRK18]MCQ2004371.1 DNA photolyase family protein [Rhizobium sp. NRK18]